MPLIDAGGAPDPTRHHIRRPQPPRDPVNLTPATNHPNISSAPFVSPSRPAGVTVNVRPPSPPAAPAAVGQQRFSRPPFFRGFQGMTYPIAGLSPSNYTDMFGPRINPVTGRASFHTGVDMGYPMGTPVLAVDNGIVGAANTNDSVYGNQIILEHGRGKETMYGHMAQFVVQPGERVKKGQVIGYVGSTGMSTGPHLHFETHVGGQPVNPLTFLGGVGDDTNAHQQGPTRQPYQGEPHAPDNTDAPYNLTPATGHPNLSSAPNMQPYAQPESPAQQLGVPGPQRNMLQAFLHGISDQESGGNYGAVGVPTAYGTALGKYQVLDSNIAGPQGWDFEALGHNITPEAYLASPKLQESIARYKLTEYFKRYGPAGAAKAWYGGPGAADSMSTSPQYGGPSIVEYAASVLQHMQQYM